MFGLRLSLGFRLQWASFKGSFRGSLVPLFRVWGLGVS